MITFPGEEQENETLRGKDIVAVLFFGTIIFLVFFGILVEKTALFTRPRFVPKELPEGATKAQREKHEDQERVRRKTVCGRCFLSFSATRNMYKLIYARGEGDSNLKVFNGVRVLSITYVILGHAYYYGVIAPQASIIGRFGWRSSKRAGRMPS